MENLRLIQPLFASLVQDFGSMATEMQNGFWKLGNIILKIFYVGSVFDPSTQIRGDRELEGNFDVIHQTDERIAILRPILKPKLHAPLSTVLRKHAKEVLARCLNTLRPKTKTANTDDVPQVDGEDDDENALPWLKKFKTEETPPKKTETHRPPRK